jgi:hypothetical protein
MCEIFDCDHQDQLAHAERKKDYTSYTTRVG